MLTESPQSGWSEQRKTPAHGGPSVTVRLWHACGASIKTPLWLSCSFVSSLQAGDVPFAVEGMLELWASQLRLPPLLQVAGDTSADPPRRCPPEDMRLVRPLAGRGPQWGRRLCGGPLPPPSPPARLVQGFEILPNGGCRPFESTRARFISRFALLPRDMRLLSTRGANVAVRDSYFLFRFPPISGCVTSERAILIADAGGLANDPGMLGTAIHRSDGLARLATDLLQRSLRMGLGRVSAPFEHVVLEAALREDVGRKQEKFARLSQLIERSAALRDQSAGAVGRSFGLLSFGADKIAQAREEAMYTLLTLADELASLQVTRRRASTILITPPSREVMACVHSWGKLVHTPNKKTEA